MCAREKGTHPILSLHVGFPHAYIMHHTKNKSCTF